MLKLIVNKTFINFFIFINNMPEEDFSSSGEESGGYRDSRLLNTHLLLSGWAHLLKLRRHFIEHLEPREGSYAVPKTGGGYYHTTFTPNEYERLKTVGARESADITRAINSFYDPKTPQAVLEERLRTISRELHKA